MEKNLNDSVSPSVYERSPSEKHSVTLMRAAFKNRTTEDCIKTAKAAGILDENGDLAPLYKNWGDKPSRTDDRDAE